MSKLVCLLAALAVVCVGVNCQFIHPTYRPPPPPRYPVMRRARDAGDQPLWLYQGTDIIRAPSTADHPVLPNIIDDVKLDPNTRYARSLGAPGRGRGASGSNRGGNRGGTDASHGQGPSNNRRNARSVHRPDFVTTPPFNPKPWTGFPPRDKRPRFPIYA